MTTTSSTQHGIVTPAFRGALLLFFLAGASATALWLLRRKSLEPQVPIDLATLIPIALWTPLFYVTSVLPESTAWAGPTGAEPHLGSIVFVPNLAVAGLFLASALASPKISRIRQEW